MKQFLSVFLLTTATFLLHAEMDSTICYLRDLDGRIREHNADFIRMQLDVKLKPQEGKVIGKVKYDFRPIQYVMDTLFLDAPSINIQKVLLNGKDTKFTTDAQGVTIRFSQSLDWNKQYKLEINYEATPHKGLYFIGWNVTDSNTLHDPYFTRHQIWTQGQGIDNRNWFPCYDDVNDKLITETIITFDTAYAVISNGVLKSKKKNADGTFTWNYAMSKPMVPYLVMLAIDKYAYKDYKSKNGMTSRQYYYADRPETVEPTYVYSAEMMDYLEKQFGVKYPWETYANIPVQDFMYGAMENTTATVYGDFLLTDQRAAVERTYTAINAHELTHQWCGDYVTEYSPAHHWLHESFATNYSKHFMGSVFGSNWYEWTKHNEAVQAINADNNDRYAIGHSKGGSARVYPKGSFVLDMLRYVVGDSVYTKTVSQYLKKHAYGNVSNHDFQMAFMETAGINLDWFFDQWIYRSGVPNYNVRYERQDDQVVFYVQQTQRIDDLASPFRMPVVFEIHTSDGNTVRTKQWLSGLADTVTMSLPAGKPVEYTLFDPSSNILKTVSFQRTFDELVAQAGKAKALIDRYDALVVLQDFNMEMRRSALIKLFAKETAAVNRAEIVRQLGKDKNDSTYELLKEALNDPDFNVRRQVIESVDEFPAAVLADAEKLLTDTSLVTIEVTLRKLCLKNPEKKAAYLAATKNLMGINNGIRIAWLELSLKDNMFGTEAQAQLKELIAYSSNRYEFRTRIKAMEALEHMNYCDEEVLLNLMNAATYTNNRLNGPATRILKNYLKVPLNLDKAKGLFKLHAFSEWERKILQPIIEL